MLRSANHNSTITYLTKKVTYYGYFMIVSKTSHLRSEGVGPAVELIFGVASLTTSGFTEGFDNLVSVNQILISERIRVIASS